MASVWKCSKTYNLINKVIFLMPADIIQTSGEFPDEFRENARSVRSCDCRLDAAFGLGAVLHHQGCRRP
ncbi:hypothetical protein RHECNPAF_6420025 [Rhizobium etli CNPAF512]|nr:hypothetical protein RHECNPAF_6420025 [Rhizobium etli CNPAF512]